MTLPGDLPFERTLVVAPHPDDESLGAGGLIAHVARRGANVRVVFLTHGENNPWPQRIARRRWHISDHDRREWGRARRREAKRALIALGVPPQAAIFLEYPDDGLPQLEKNALPETIARVLREFRPTLLVIPSADDFHPDHRATHRAVQRALAGEGIEHPELILGYVVHGSLTAREQQWVDISDEERLRKRDAIKRHATQMMLSRGRFLRYARREELYAVVTDLDVQEETRLVRWKAKVRHILSLLF
ncbi:MAG TPA: PIG-L deacetylase family protein [Thermoanaerobaculia bacterium]